MLVEPIGHLGAVFSHLDLYINSGLEVVYMAPYMRDKIVLLYHTQAFSVVKIGRLLRE